MYIRVGEDSSTPTYTSNEIYFRTGSGVSSYEMQYANSAETGKTATISGSNSSTTLYVRSGTNATLTDIEYKANYGSPYQFVEWDSTWTSIVKTFDQGDANVYSSGTRYIKLAATYYPKYYYQIKAHGAGGTFSDGSTYWWSAVLSTTGDGGWVSYPASNIPTPTRSDYTFKGWSVSESSTATVTNIEFTATSESNSSPTSKEVWAVWEPVTYSGYIRLGEGINSAAVYVDGALKSQISDRNYHELLNLVSGSSEITVKSIAKASGYGRPYTFRFFTSATATTPSTTLEVDADEPSYKWLNARVYAEIMATKTHIDTFYWDSANTDAALIAKGQPVSNLTAARWNRLLAKIKEVAAATGGSFAAANVSSGGTFYASEFNEARLGIFNLPSHGTLPGTKASDDDVLAALFEGSGSLKAALNAAINHYNNS